MSDDLLERSIRALRDGTTAHNNGADEMLARIERSRVPSIQRRRVRFRAAALAFAAAFVGFGAWASVTGRVTALFSDKPAEVVENPSETNSPAPRKLNSPSLPTTPDAPTVVPSASASSDVAPQTPTAVPSPIKGVPTTPQGPKQPTSKSTASAASSATTPEVPAPADVNELYRDAHRLHFAERNWSAALVAWDRYLSAAGPRGSMFLEARYNRGLVLMRLGRNAEAAAALEPFAAGEYGGYRRDEARALLEKLKQ